MGGMFQFRLRRLMIVTAFAAAGCALLRYLAKYSDATGRTLGVVALPMLAFVAVAMRRRWLTGWLGVFIATLFALMTLELLARLLPDR